MSKKSQYEDLKRILEELKQHNEEVELVNTKIESGSLHGYIKKADIEGTVKFRMKYNKDNFLRVGVESGNYKDKIPIVCLAGHTHSPDRFQNMEHNCYNVALDAHKCFPVSIDDIIADIKEYRKTHAATEYPDRSPYCASCNNVACLARNTHTLPCEGYIPKDTIS